MGKKIINGSCKECAKRKMNKTCKHNFNKITGDNDWCSAFRKKVTKSKNDIDEKTAKMYLESLNISNTIIIDIDGINGVELSNLLMNFANEYGKY